jgi:hypothetical protein
MIGLRMFVVMDSYWLAGSKKRSFSWIPISWLDQRKVRLNESLLVGWVKEKIVFMNPYSLLVGWVKEKIVFMNPYWVAG